MRNNPEGEYNPYDDEDFGQRSIAPIDWSGHPWLAIYMAKLAKGWPANMAAVAAKRGLESK